MTLSGGYLSSRRTSNSSSNHSLECASVTPDLRDSKSQKPRKHIFSWKANSSKENACWQWHSFLCRAGMLDFWKGLRAWNFLWAECLKSLKLEWQIRQNHSPHVEKSAEAFKHMTYEMTQLGFFLSSVSGYYWEHWRCGFASCYVSLKSSWKELTGCFQNVERNMKTGTRYSIRNFSTFVKTSDFIIN